VANGDSDVVIEENLIIDETPTHIYDRMLSTAHSTDDYSLNHRQGIYLSISIAHINISMYLSIYLSVRNG
jgi:hypothetical protein